MTRLWVLRLPARPTNRVARPDDRGSAAAAVIIFAVLFMALAAFVIDGGLSISQRERAADIAEQAARYAAQDLDREAQYEGRGTAPINYANCGSRVQDYARETGMSGGDIAASHCLAADVDFVEVEIQLTYKPVLTGLFYDSAITVHGTSRAEIRTG
ncbi:pilus assembly protein TadG-related protein [Streptomyces sp. H27-D2]|uniref:pilus assembly protein TadG-related protein n=1 Tax=Streptomyces sp. H27-D2 TaxID=3046304 RepID=UPI002DB89354|nr:pilus assembly protein TadG-related protein [Streptomyces sp. H27-D2]MEC4016493.1 pilus assembly protein TadG-related protein [Streptomyces sp. H27-D2]